MGYVGWPRGVVAFVARRRIFRAGRDQAAPVENKPQARDWPRRAARPALAARTGGRYDRQRIAASGRRLQNTSSQYGKESR
jgi:hypothetical protein